MAKYFYIILLTSMIFACNTGNHNSSTVHQGEGEGEEVPSDISNNIKPTEASVTIRIKEIYNDIFSHMKEDDFHEWPYLKYFDDNLRELWSYIPDEGPGLGFDPWTCSQDYDETTLEVISIKVNDIHGDASSGYTTEAIVKLKLSENWKPGIIRLVLTTKNKGYNDFEWYVADIFDLNEPSYKGVVAEIQDEFTH